MASLAFRCRSSAAGRYFPSTRMCNIDATSPGVLLKLPMPLYIRHSRSLAPVGKYVFAMHCSVMTMLNLIKPCCIVVTNLRLTRHSAAKQIQVADPGLARLFLRTGGDKRVNQSRRLFYPRRALLQFPKAGLLAPITFDARYDLRLVIEFSLSMLSPCYLLSTCVSPHVPRSRASYRASLSSIHNL
ncbi:uncharacterized protein K460DRAFT_42291 [Cucurbitaria berberidis CBS 394.84]|uniref:Uncharacterized protein n=1 Tax=Cucurbitaria berberidis CBS 394.84 TaxID=1168544 RepID=A0A9P4LF94_9PLEO|nr:uncharacterized protein K460DRAFT_42291 [Cucurbitaria berberidis CBS 394.84]KAF1851839.1 hypothetical protein K460DRAFT_42291 [Cucurbitaria berberidis CBS 394.84]